MKKFILCFIFLTAFILLGSSGIAKPLPHKYLPDQQRITSLFFENTERETDSITLIAFGKPVQDTLLNGKQKRIKEIAKAKPQAKPEKLKPVNRPPAGNPGNGRTGNGAPNVRPGGQGQEGVARPGKAGTTRPQPTPGRRGP